ncbi:ImmA/IrrE family metallo-endopeptidase [Actinokineospora fastidiosa]|uniref:Regulator component n=1 Tax=Actinokineospora fastidiosa TaxID=1816 RepID=A0A918GDV4_9PSEU|nr:ImmA/IrrE family metallo-endopeptidase [Actinokineospora fastidiosa]GGS30779.1 hypothetical protein GCM10010171_25520 [Actinokineospora fastidiosa]
MAGRRSDLRRIRRECGRLLDGLRLPARADLAGLCGHLAAARGRPLHVVSVSMRASQPCGLWLSTRDEDYVFYDADTGRAHQEHIILHEIGHLICGHTGGGDPVPDLFPDLDPDLVRAMLARTTYSDEQEQQAEIMAYLLAEILRAPSVDADDVAARIADSLNHSAHREPR